MTDKELKEIREKISCPQFNDDHYGEWGILNVNQRLTIKRLLDLVDGQEAYIKNQQAEIERLKEEIEIRNQKRASIFEISNAYERGRAEAIKEFAERLKEHLKGNGGLYCVTTMNAKIDNLVKERVGEGK